MSLLKYFKKTTEPLVLTKQPTGVKKVLGKRKRPVGRPRKEREASPGSSAIEDHVAVVEETGQMTEEGCSSTSEAIHVLTESQGKSSFGLKIASAHKICHIGCETKKRRMRTQYTHAQKAKVAKYTKFHGPRAAGRHFGIHHKNAARWFKEGLDEVKVTTRSKRVNKKGQGRKISYPQDIDEEIYKWVLEKHEVNNIPISSAAIKAKALSLIRPILPDFKASGGWLNGFKRRFDLVLRARTSIAQALPADLEQKIDTFRQQVNFVRQNSDFPYEYIGNMDETPIIWTWCPIRP